MTIRLIDRTSGDGSEEVTAEVSTSEDTSSDSWLGLVTLGLLALLVGLSLGMVLPL